MKIIRIFFLLLILSSCNNQKNSSVEKKTENIKPGEVIKSVETADPNKKSVENENQGEGN